MFSGWYWSEGHRLGSTFKIWGTGLIRISNAFSMGNNIDIFDQVAHSLFWMVSRIHDVTEVRAVTVEWCFLNPCWAITNRLFIPVKEVDHLSFHHCFDNLTKHRKGYNCWDMSTHIRLRPTLKFPWLTRQF